MNECDEVWTPSALIAQWYRDVCGITRPVFVYEHGVDPVWEKKPRKVEDKFRFLHVGAEAVRKGGRDVMGAFRAAFPNPTDVELTMKMISPGWSIGAINGINILNKRMELSELIDVFHSHHAFVYPSYGEGFGLNPLQAIATGMPTATVGFWAPYERFLHPDLNISSTFCKSPWPAFHPGAMVRPSKDDTVDAMRAVYENYEKYHSHAQESVKAVTEYYNWDTLTAKAFGDLENRLKSS